MVTKQEARKTFDAFLSPLGDDRDPSIGEVLSIESLAFSTHTDCKEDLKINRHKVTPAIVATLRKRLRNSRCPFCSVTLIAKHSAWIKWESGSKDNYNDHTSILSVDIERSRHCSGQQFLRLYPYAARGTVQSSQQETPSVYCSRTCYVNVDHWFDGKEPYEFYS